MTIEEIEKLCNKATPGPWYYDSGNMQVESHRTDLYRLPIVDIASISERREWAEEHEIKDSWDRDDDGDFIAAARILMPKLLAVAKAAKNDRARGGFNMLMETGKALEELEKE